MKSKNPLPFDVETGGVMRKHFSDVEQILLWWESIGMKKYRYAATNWNVNFSVFLDKKSWFFANDKKLLVQAAMQWGQYQHRIEWKEFDSKHPILGDSEDAPWFEQPDGWWEVSGLPFGLTNFDVICRDKYSAPDGTLLNKSLSTIESEKAITDAIFETAGIVRDDDSPSISGVRVTHDVFFFDASEYSVTAVIQEELAERSTGKFLSSMMLP